MKDCRKLSFSRVTCCFDWSSSHFDSRQCFKTLCFRQEKKSRISPVPVPVDWFLEQKLLSMWQALCLWYRNVILTIKMLDWFYLCFVTLFSLVNWKYLVLFDCYLEQELLSMWQALCLWYRNVNLTIKNVRLILFVFRHIV